MSSQPPLEEAQHRARNDFQLVMSLLMLHRRRAEPSARRGLTRLMERVATIGLAHDRPGGDASGQVELSTYLQAICAGFAHRRADVAVSTDLAPAVVPHERAVPLGLVVDELVANAIEHAFPGQRAGTITVSLHATPDGEGVLRVQDDGAGLAPAAPDGVGAELVRRLAQQAGGRTHRETLSPGTAITVRFPLQH